MKAFAKIFLPVIIILLFSNCHKPYDDYDMLETVLTNGVWAVSKGEYVETSITIDSATQEVIDSVVSFDDTELTEKDKDMRLLFSGSHKFYMLGEYGEKKPYLIDKDHTLKTIEHSSMLTTKIDYAIEISWLVKGDTLMFIHTDTAGQTETVNVKIEKYSDKSFSFYYKRIDTCKNESRKGYLDLDIIEVYATYKNVKTKNTEIIW